MNKAIKSLIIHYQTDLNHDDTLIRILVDLLRWYGDTKAFRECVTTAVNTYIDEQYTFKN